MEPTRTLQCQWTSKQALILITICLMAGITGGWFIRGWQRTLQSATAQTVATKPTANDANTPVNAAPAEPPSPSRLKEMADAQAAPLLEKLKSDPKNLEVLISIGNLYYDAQEYPIAIDYYGRALQSKPSDAAVRTDMATAYWYMGKADEAIREFNKALTYAPTNPNTLFNLGLVKWQGKHDSAGAIADWKKLLSANPNYEQKDKVQQMLGDAEKQATAKPGDKS